MPNGKRAVIPLSAARGRVTRGGQNERPPPAASRRPQQPLEGKRAAASPEKGPTALRTELEQAGSRNGLTHRRFEGRKRGATAEEGPREGELRLPSQRLYRAVRPGSGVCCHPPRPHSRFAVPKATAPSLESDFGKMGRKRRKVKPLRRKRALRGLQ